MRKQHMLALLIVLFIIISLFITACQTANDYDDPVPRFPASSRDISVYCNICGINVGGVVLQHNGTVYVFFDCDHFDPAMFHWCETSNQWRGPFYE